MQLWRSLRQVAQEVIRRSAAAGVGDASADAPEEGGDELFEDEHKTEPFPTEPGVSTGTLPGRREEVPAPDADAVGAATVLTPSFLGETLCRATVKPYLDRVNVRAGPGLHHPRIGRTLGAEAFGLAALSVPDADGHPWAWIVWDGGSGWVRTDLLDLAGDLPRPDAAVTPVPLRPETTADRWPSPVPGRILQDYHVHHPAYDLAASPGTVLLAAAAGVVIRARAVEPPGTVRPAALDPEARAAVFASAAWGFGYGSLVVVRHDYDLLPAGLRQAMADLDLAGGFAYVLYAHLGRLDVQTGQSVAAGDSLGAVGETGYTAGPGLHLEVRVGLAETISDIGREQAVVPPGLLFAVEPH